MPRPKRQKQELRELITETAAEMFGRNGYHAVTVEQIAKALGISKPSIYYHFSSKDEILFEFGYISHKRATDRLREIVAMDLPPREKLEQALSAHIDLLSFDAHKGPMLGLHLRFSMPKNYEAPIKELRKEYDTLLRQIIVDGMTQGIFKKTDPKVIGYTMAGAINFLPQWYSPDGPHSSEDIKKIIIDYLINGICETVDR